MARVPRKPPAKRKTDAPPERVVSRKARAPDARQPELNLAPMPGWIEPCLPTLVDKVPSGDQWLYEVKWDGYRVSLYIERGNVKIMTRNGNDWTKRFPLVASAAGKMARRFAMRAQSAPAIRMRLLWP
jgi:bifunctional non-homologous end joining protein LigD